jgi:subtilisin-like proprotein convertase family protein
VRKNAVRSERLRSLSALAAACRIEALEGRVFLSATAGSKSKPAPVSKVGTALLSASQEYASYRAAGKAANQFHSKDKLLLTQSDSVAIQAYTLGDPKKLEADLLKLKGTHLKRFQNGVAGLIPLDQISQLSSLASLNFARPIWARTMTGSVTSQGDAAERADIARNTYGYTGAGVKVGVLSDSFDTGPGSYATDISTGDLPAGISNLEDYPSGTDEGRAMAQLIYDSAPGASLAFATAFNGEADFANNIKALRDAGAKVIVDDVFYLDEPMFQDGVVAQAVDDVVASGVSYFSAAGNQARQAYESGFTADRTLSVAAIPSSVAGLTFAGGITHDFDPGAGQDDMQNFSLANGQAITLSFQWNQPYGSIPGSLASSASDMDVYVLNAAGTQVVGGTASINAGPGTDPVEVFQFTNTTGATANFQLMLVLRNGVAPTDMKYVNFDTQNFTEWNTNSGTVFGHANAAGAAAVAAAPFASTPAYGVNPPAVEYFSSAGTTPIYFNPNGTPIGSPVYRQSPRFTAPDGGNTTFFYSDSTIDPDSTPNFYGTSAAAPAAAAVGALLLQAKPSLTPQQLYTVLASTAQDMDDPSTGGFDVGYDSATGFGFIRADAALASVAGTSLSGQTFHDNNSNGVVDGGETPYAGVTVYLDANNNGALDTGTASPASTDIPKPVPDTGTVLSNLPVSGLVGAVTDVNVTLSITHTWDADLDIYLISPNGTRVELSTDNGGSDDNYTGTIFDDEAATSITAGSAPFTGSFKPEGSLSDIDGQDPNGTWKLEVSDDESFDSGTLTSWSLNLTTAELSTVTDGGGNYTFTEKPAGSYNIRQLAPAGFIQVTPTFAAYGIGTVAGLGYPNLNFGEFPISFTAGSNNDAYVVSELVDGTTVQVLETIGANPTSTYTIPKTTLAANALSFNGAGGDDTFTVDYLNGSPIPGGGITFNGAGNTGVGDSLVVLGGTSADTATFNASSVTLGGTINTNGVENVSFDGRGGLDVVAVNAGGVTFPASQHFQSLTVANGASATLAAGGSRTLYTKSLTIGATGKLDLKDNDLLLDYTGSTPIGSWTGSGYTGVLGLVQSGRNGGGWAGNGIVTSQTQATTSNLTTLATAEGAQVFGLGAGQTHLYGTETVDDTTVIIKYTYGGDANLDGKINVDDYTRIDFNVPLATTAWFNGDFNYDGKINVDDYTILDFNVGIQGAPL